MIYKSMTDIQKAIVKKAEQFEGKYGSAEFWNKEEIHQDPEMRLLTKLFRVYLWAETKSLKHGYIGVGCITYAEHAIQKFQRRLGAQ